LGWPGRRSARRADPVPQITLQGGEAIVVDRRPVRDTLVTGVLES